MIRHWSAYHFCFEVTAAVRGVPVKDDQGDDPFTDIIVKKLKSTQQVIKHLGDL